MSYFEKEDTLHLVLLEGSEADSIELGPNVTAELNETGQVIGIEIIHASSFIRESVLASAKARKIDLAAKGV